MKITLQEERVHSTRAMGDACPYVVKQPSGVILCSDFAEAIAHIPPDERALDPVALISLLQHGYVCGDRTLVRGLVRLPFHASVDGAGTVQLHPQLAHGMDRVPPDRIAHHLLELLVSAVERAVRNEDRVYLLLSGGLDSRAIAGALGRLQAAHSFQVTALTWGWTTCRDWDYAQRICDLYGWEHVNLPLNPQSLWENLERSVHFQGAEVSGLHLHALPKLHDHVPPGGLVLTGIYGDSIGRGAYQSINVLRLRRPGPSNRWQLVPRMVYRRHRYDLARDLAAPLARGPCHTRQQTFELGMVENYMRRHINQAMSFLCSEYRLSLPFAEEDIVRYMWSIDPALRDDRVYLHLIPLLDQALGRIPWQKTNRPLVPGAAASASLSAGFADYSGWIQTDLRDRVTRWLASDALRQNPFLNHDRVLRLWAHYQQGQFSSYPKLFDRVSRLFGRLVGVALLETLYSVRPAPAAERRSTWLDRSPLYTDMLCAREQLKSALKARLGYADYRAKGGGVQGPK